MSELLFESNVSSEQAGLILVARILPQSCVQNLKVTFSGDLSRTPKVDVNYFSVFNREMRP